MIIRILRIRKTIQEIKEAHSNPKEALQEFMYSVVQPFFIIATVAILLILAALVWWIESNPTTLAWILFVLGVLAFATIRIAAWGVKKILKLTIQNMSAHAKTAYDRQQNRIQQARHFRE